MTKVRSLSVSVAVLALLLVTAARAAANTWTVDPSHSGACDTTARVCPTINSAIAAAAAGDEIDIKPATYTETVNVSKDNLTLKGGSTGTSGVALKPGATGAPLTVSGNGDTIESMLVFDAANHGGAIQVTGNAGTISDAIVLATSEPAVVFKNSGSNVLQRTTAIANGANTVELHAANGAASNLAIDSTIAVGTGGSAAVLATSEGSLAPLIGGGNASITARHLTASGQTYGLLANAPVLLSGSAAITADNSIVHGKTAATNATQAGLSTASATTTHSDTTSADTDLFVNPAQFDFHLKKGAAVINQGTDTPAGDATDIDGQSRLIGAATDLGADEYDDLTNTAATLTATPSTATPGQAVAFQAAATPDAATTNGIDHFVINFGDGSATVNSATGAANHAYAAAGTYHPTAVAVGKSGAVSAAGTATVTVSSSSTGGGGGGGTGGTGGNATGACTGGFTQPNGSPTTLILSPRNNGVLKLKRTMTKKVKRHGKTRRIKVKVFNPPTVSGVVCDADGVGSVKIAVLYLGKSKKLPSTGTCRAFNGTTSFTSVSCGSTPFFSTKLSDFNWRFKFSSKSKLKTGYYAVFVKATDLKGNTSQTLSPAAGTVAVFREK